ncbi:MAG: alpha/beta fold hydrolase [Sphingomonas sp.]
MTLLLLHGWGFDASLWNGIVAALPGRRTVRWDRGYFAAPMQADVAPVLAVGHSLGALLLAAWLPPHVPLVAINGFDRFAGDDAVPPRLLDRMRARLTRSPQGVLDDFRARCGASPAPPIADAAALSADLDRLATMAAPANGRRMLLLNGADDPILPRAMRAATFAGAMRETAAGGHLLPVTHPGWCAERIAAWS